MQNSHKITSIIIRTEYRDELILRPIPPTSRIRYSQVSSIGQMASPLANWGNGVKMEVPSKRKRTHLPNSGAGIRQPSRTFYQNPKFPLSVHTSPQPPLCMFSGYPFSSAQCLWLKRFFFYGWQRKSSGSKSNTSSPVSSGSLQQPAAKARHSFST